MTVGLTLIMLLTACNGDSPVVEIEQIRDDGRKVELDKTIADRFFVSKKDASQPTPESVIADLLVWEVPKGWLQLPARQFRAINLKAGNVECYVSVLTGGGVAGNLNRWRQQMGQAPLVAAEIDKLEKISIFEREAHFLDTSGTYTSMLAGAKAGYRMRALYAQFPQFAMSVKMVGPDKEVLGLDAAFRGFCASLAFDREKAQGVDKAASKPPTPAAGARKLAWDVPAGWTKGTGSSMRHVTYDVAAGVQCYITFLPGTVGGVLNNLNRWLGEVGEAHIDQAAADRLPRLEILGRSSHYLNKSGVSKGVLVTYTPLDGEAMFVKLTGPRDVVKTQVVQFEAFCRSLR